MRKEKDRYQGTRDRGERIPEEHERLPLGHAIRDKPCVELEQARDRFREPSTKPRNDGVAPIDAANTGRSGKIISAPTSVRKLVRPSAVTAEGIARRGARRHCHGRFMGSMDRASIECLWNEAAHQSVLEGKKRTQTLADTRRLRVDDENLLQLPTRIGVQKHREIRIEW